MAEPVVNVHVKGTDDGAGSLMDKLAQKARELRKEQSLSGERALGSLARRPGGLSELALGSMGIGLPVLGIELGAHALEGMTEKINELRKSYADGKVDQSDYVFGMLKAVPVIGTVIGSVDGLIKSITGETAAKEKAIEADKKWMEQKHKLAEENAVVTKLIRSSTEESEAMEFRARTSFMQEGLQKSQAEALDNFKSQLSKIYDEQKAALKEAGADDATIKGLKPGTAAYFTANERAVDINTATSQRVKALSDSSAAASLKAEREHDRLSLETRIRQNDEIEDVESSLMQRRLELSGRGLDAELEQIRRSGEKKKEELERQQAELGRTGLGSAESDANIQRLKDLTDAETAAAAAEAKKKFTATVADMQSQARQTEMRFIGNKQGADIESIKQDYATKFANAGSDEQRAALSEMMAAELLNARKSGITYTGRTSPSTSESGSFSSGAYEARVNRVVPDRQGQTLQQLLDEAKKITGFIEQARQNAKAGGDITVQLLKSLSGV